jgi:ATP-dependent Lon protease
MHIACRFFLPKQLKCNGLDASHITITDPALLRYRREAGVRSLERAIGGVVRYKAVEWTEHLVALASQRRGNTDTSDDIQRSEYDRVVEEHQLDRCGEVGWEREEGG